MNWALAFGEQLVGFGGQLGRRVVDEFEGMHSAWRAWAEVEHNDDGTHSGITADSITAASIQPTPSSATTTALGDTYDARNNRASGPWQFLHVWTAFIYNSLTIGAAASSQVTIDTTSPSGAGLNLRTTKGIIPFTDNVADLGVAFNPPGVSNASNKRWRHIAVADTIFFGSANSRLRSGTGTPEGVVTGNVGDIWIRTNGGAGTTFYIKETGTSSTGWAAK